MRFETQRYFRDKVFIHSIVMLTSFHVWVKMGIKRINDIILRARTSFICGFSVVRYYGTHLFELLAAHQEYPFKHTCENRSSSTCRAWWSDITGWTGWTCNYTNISLQLCSTTSNVRPKWNIVFFLVVNNPYCLRQEGHVYPAFVFLFVCRLAMSHKIAEWVFY